jgi:hypothetical protein
LFDEDPELSSVEHQGPSLCWSRIIREEPWKLWFWNFGATTLTASLGEGLHRQKMPTDVFAFGDSREMAEDLRLLDKVAVDRVRNQEYLVPGDGSEDDRCGGQDAVYDE